MTTILIVDDHPALRLVLKTQLEQVLGVNGVLEADNGQAAVEAVRQYTPDLVVLDLDIPKINGLDVVPRLKALQAGIRILVVSGQDQRAFATRAMQAGAQGFVSKTQDLKEIVRCVEAVMAGYMVFPALPRDSGASARVPTPDEERLRRLSDKEVIILQMLTKGLSNKAIGEALFISNKTVSSHKARIMIKLQVGSLVELVDFARRCKIAA